MFPPAAALRASNNRQRGRTGGRRSTSHSCSCRALKSDKKAICAAHPSRNDAMMLWISPLMQFTLSNPSQGATTTTSVLSRWTAKATGAGQQPEHSRIVLHVHQQRGGRALGAWCLSQAPGALARERAKGNAQHTRWRWLSPSAASLPRGSLPLPPAHSLRAPAPPHHQQRLLRSVKHDHVRAPSPPRLYKTLLPPLLRHRSATQPAASLRATWVGFAWGTEK